MRYAKRYTRIISARYAALREREERDRELRSAVARKDPDFVEAERAYLDASLSLARSKALGKATEQEIRAYDAAKKAMDELCSEKCYDLGLHVRCKKCGDTGFIGEKLCSCAMPLYLALVK